MGVGQKYAAVFEKIGGLLVFDLAGYTSYDEVDNMFLGIGEIALYPLGDNCHDSVNMVCDDVFPVLNGHLQSFEDRHKNVFCHVGICLVQPKKSRSFSVPSETVFCYFLYISGMGKGILEL